MLELISLKGYYFGPEGTGYGVDFNPGKYNICLVKFL